MLVQSLEEKAVRTSVSKLEEIFGRPKFLGKLNSETYDHWIDPYPCPEIVQPKYIPAKAVLQKSIEAKADEASDLQQSKSEVDSSFDRTELDAAN